VTRFLNFGPNHIFGIGEARHFKLRVLIDTEEYECTRDRLPPRGMCSAHVTSSNFGKYVEMVELKTNRKSYVAYRMIPLRVTFSVLEGHFCIFKPLCPSATVVRVHNGALAE